MKCQILFSGKNKKNIINLPSAENAQRVVKVKLGCSLQKAICTCPALPHAAQIPFQGSNSEKEGVYSKRKKKMLTRRVANSVDYSHTPRSVNL